MEAILGAIKAGRIPSARPRIVISNKPDAQGLRTASEKYGILTKIVLPEGMKGWDYDRKLSAALEEADITPENGLVCLAGFMRIISPEFIRHFRSRLLNIHPALLPSFPGLHAQRQALDYGVKVSGCTVHFVDEGVDSGPVVLQKAVQVIEGDTEETLSARILEQEHQAYPEAVRLFTEGLLSVEGRKVHVLG